MNLAHQEEKDQLENKIKQLQQELTDKVQGLQDQIKHHKEELGQNKDKYQKDLGDKNLQIAKLQLCKEQLQKQLEQDSADNQNEIDQLQQKLAKYNEQLQNMSKENEQLRDKMLKESNEDGKNTATSSECGDTMSGIQTTQSMKQLPSDGILLNRLYQLTNEIDKKRKQLSDLEASDNILKTELVSEREKTKIFPNLVQDRDNLKNKLIISQRDNQLLHQRIIDLTNKLVLKDNQIDSTNRIVFDLKQELSIVNKKNKDQKRNSIIKPTTTLPKQKPVYKVTDPNDEIDTKLSEILNFTGCPVPISRVGNGVYMFGNKRITATMQGGRLVIRVGGGFMVVQEFINSYGQQELMKMEQIKLKKQSLQQNVQESQYTNSHHQSLMSENQFSASPMKDAFGMSALQAYATNSSKVKPKPTIPKLNTNHLSIQNQRRSSAIVGGGGGFSSFKTPLKSDRQGQKRDNVGVVGVKTPLKRMNSQQQFQNVGQSKLTSNKSKDDLFKASTKNRKSNIGLQRGGSYYQSDLKSRKKSFIHQSDTTAEMIAQLADQNLSPLYNTTSSGDQQKAPYLFEQGKSSNIKINTALNGGSTRVRSFNNKEIKAIRKLADSRAGKSEQEKAVKDISKSMMIHDRKFSASIEVEECLASFEDDNISNY